MNIDNIPNESDTSWLMYAYVDADDNEVVWHGVQQNGLFIDHIADRSEGLFQVWRRDNIVIVQAMGWYSSDFHFRMELTELPDRVVMIAKVAADTMAMALDDRSSFVYVVG